MSGAMYIDGRKVPQISSASSSGLGWLDAIEASRETFVLFPLMFYY